LVHGLENCLEIVQELTLPDTPHDMACSVAFGNARRKRRFILIRAAELFESKSDRANLALANLSHETEKRPRIDSRRQKGAYFYIGKKMRTHAVNHSRSHSVRDFSRWGATLTFRKYRCETDKRLRLARPRAIDPLGMACR
jgi:hypothetical protein